MKKLLIYLFLGAFAISLLILGCSEFIEKNDDQKEGIRIGYFLKDGGIPEMGLTFEEAVAFIVEHNSNVDVNYNYNYTEVWIEELENHDLSISYYLASRADVTDGTGEKVYSCYTHYIPLVEDSGGLIYAPVGGGATGVTCTGHCCKTCVLKKAVPPQTDPSCECDLANTVDDCSGKTGYCDQTTTWD